MPKSKPIAAKEPPASPDLSVRAAWLYYIEGLTQEEVSKVMAVSRAKVIRLVAAARDHGIVGIRIDANGSDQLALERRLADAYGLSEAVVTPAPTDNSAVAAVVGHATGMYLADHIRDGMSLGVGWGVTLSMSLKALGARPSERFSVIPLLGGMPHSRAINPSAVARRIADAVGAAVGEVLCHFLDADGNLVDHPVSRRVVAVGLEDLRRVPKIVIAAGGRHKVEAIRAVLKATRARVLIRMKPPPRPNAQLSRQS